MSGPGNVAVTHADIDAAYEFAARGFQSAYDYEMALRDAFARHRQSHTDLLATAREVLADANDWFLDNGYGEWFIIGLTTTLASIDAALGKQDTQEGEG